MHTHICFLLMQYSNPLLSEFAISFFLFNFFFTGINCLTFIILRLCEKTTSRETRNKSKNIEEAYIQNSMSYDYFTHTNAHVLARLTQICWQVLFFVWFFVHCVYLSICVLLSFLSVAFVFSSYFIRTPKNNAA